eukprot:1158190-Pelagomonas_calceolata.AAC.5
MSRELYTLISRVHAHHHGAYETLPRCQDTTLVQGHYDGTLLTRQHGVRTPPSRYRLLRTVPASRWCVQIACAQSDCISLFGTTITVSSSHLQLYLQAGGACKQCVPNQTAYLCLAPPSRCRLLSCKRYLQAGGASK